MSHFCELKFRALLKFGVLFSFVEILKNIPFLAQQLAWLKRREFQRQ